MGGDPLSPTTPTAHNRSVNDRTASRLAWSGWALSSVLAAVGCVLVWINSGATTITGGDLGFSVFIAVAGVGYATVGGLIASRQRDTGERVGGCDRRRGVPGGAGPQVPTRDPRGTPTDQVAGLRGRRGGRSHALHLRGAGGVSVRQPTGRRHLVHRVACGPLLRHPGRG